MSIDGINESTILTLVSEVGVDLVAKFPSAKHFSSWLSLSPNKRITGGRVLSSRTNKNKNPLAYAFRMAANAVGNQLDSPLGHFFRRIAYRRGRKVAVTATARKLAVIVYNMITKGTAYQPLDLEKYQEQLRRQKVKQIQRTIVRLEIQQEEVGF